MAFYNLFSGEKPSAPIICYNSDTLFDCMTGELRQGVDGKFYINGGLSTGLTGVMARPNMYKSTFSNSILTRIAAIYQQNLAIFDSEGSVSRGPERIFRTAGNHSCQLSPDQIMMFNAETEYDLAEVLKKLKEIGEVKKAHLKDFTLTTPFLDVRTGEAQKVIAPTLIFLDSLTDMHGGEEEDLLEGKEGINDSKVKTVYMKDANAKTIFIRKALRYATEYGFIIVSTAHYVKKLNLDSYGPSPKQLQFMQQDYGPKGVGSEFMFRTSPQFFVKNCKCLQDDAKECWYKNGNTPPTDINEIIGEIHRCKNAASGTTHPYIVSQSSGLLSELTDYNYLKAMKFGLGGNNVTCNCMFNPGVNLTRNSIRGVCERDPKEVRALQLCAQLCYIQKNWNDQVINKTFGFSAHVEPERIMEFLSSGKCKYTVDKLLTSRGYWLPDEILKTDKDVPEYISIFDVLEAYSKNGAGKTVVSTPTKA